MKAVPNPDSSATRRALVTGAAAGIGWSTVNSLAELGMACVLADLDAEGGNRRVSQLSQLGASASFFKVDLADTAAAAALPHQAAERLGGLDVIINNAGVTEYSGKSIAELPEWDVARLIDINLTAVEAICAAAMDVLKPGGIIINVASGAGFRALPQRGAYSATKAAVVGLCQDLLPSYRERELGIGCVAPGFVYTELVHKLIGEGRLDPAIAKRRIPLGRFAEPQEIADAILFLISPPGRLLDGQCLAVDGGSGVAGGKVMATGCARQPLAANGAALIIGKGIHADGLAAALLAGTVHRTECVDGPEGAAALLASTNKIASIYDMREAAACGPGEHLKQMHGSARASWDHFDRCGSGSLIFYLHSDAGSGGKATENAVGMFSQTLSLEWGGSGHRVISVASRGDDPGSVAGLLAYLTSPKASYITGISLSIGGHG